MGSDIKSDSRSRILVTGGSGQLGSELKRLLGTNPSIFYTDVNELDITKREAVERFLLDNDIEIVINCAAYTAVDKAEDEETAAGKVNASAPRNLADSAIAVWRAGASAKGGPLIIHISTDYVFDGKSNRPYTEDFPTAPASAYGRTKLEGEQALINSGCNYIILRTSWLYSAFGSNFVKTILRLTGERDSLDVVFDQVGTPTFAGDLATVICKVLTKWELSTDKERRDLCGIYNFSNEGVCSWYDFAKEIVKRGGNSCKINPVTSDKFITKAVRPAYSVMDKRKIKETFGLVIRHWMEPLDDEKFWKNIQI